MRVLCFGEILLRLSPQRGRRLMDATHLDRWVAGAEANVATALACLGHDAAIASVVPDNELGRAARTVLRGHGVDVATLDTGPGRMGLYFATPGAGQRPTDVLYDRAGSSFAIAAAERWNWPALLTGVDLLGVSGITAALGTEPEAAVIAGARAAAARGVPVAVDINHRAKLWAARDGDSRQAEIALAEQATLLFAGPADLARLLGQGAGTAHAFATWPELAVIASTRRDSGMLAATVATRASAAHTPPCPLGDVVDRIGAGDAFAAGVIDAFARGCDATAMASDGLRLALLKHTLAGDAATFSREDLAVAAGARDILR